MNAEEEQFYLAEKKLREYALKTTLIMKIENEIEAFSAFRDILEANSRLRKNDNFSHQKLHHCCRILENLLRLKEYMVMDDPRPQQVLDTDFSSD